jgi:hypothetical protein
MGNLLVEFPAGSCVSYSSMYRLEGFFPLAHGKLESRYFQAQQSLFISADFFKLFSGEKKTFFLCGMKTQWGEKNLYQFRVSIETISIHLNV